MKWPYHHSDFGRVRRVLRPGPYECVLRSRRFLAALDLRLDFFGLTRSAEGDQETIRLTQETGGQLHLRSRPLD